MRVLCHAMSVSSTCRAGGSSVGMTRNRHAGEAGADPSFHPGLDLEAGGLHRGLAVVGATGAAETAPGLEAGLHLRRTLVVADSSGAAVARTGPDAGAQASKSNAVIQGRA